MARRWRIWSAWPWSIPGALCLRLGAARGHSTAVNPSINHTFGSGEDHFVVLFQQMLEERIAQGGILFGPGFRVTVHKKERRRLLEFCLQNIPGARKNAIGGVIVRIKARRTPPDVSGEGSRIDISGCGSSSRFRIQVVHLSPKEDLIGRCRMFSYVYTEFVIRSLQP